MRLRTLRLDLACVVALLLAASPVGAQYEKANQEYAAGDFKGAIGDYETLVRNSEYSANLFYNLGNAYFRAQDPGKAILNYERALALDRHHAEAEANLQVARDEARALEIPPSPAERLLRFASANQFAVTAAISFWIFLFLIAYSFHRRRLTILSILCLSILVVAIFGAYTIEERNRTLAIVTANNVQARVATADTANSVLALPPGSEIKVVSQRGDWIYAAFPNNVRGWIPAKSAEPVRL